MRIRFALNNRHREKRARFAETHGDNRSKPSAKHSRDQAIRRALTSTVANNANDCFSPSRGHLVPLPLFVGYQSAVKFTRRETAMRVYTHSHNYTLDSTSRNTALSCMTITKVDVRHQARDNNNPTHIDRGLSHESATTQTIRIEKNLTIIYMIYRSLH